MLVLMRQVQLRFVHQRKGCKDGRTFVANLQEHFGQFDANTPFPCPRFSGIKMTGVSKTSLLIFVVFARFLALTAKFWQVNDHRKRQELTINQYKATIFRSKNLKGLVFLSPEF